MTKRLNWSNYQERDGKMGHQESRRFSSLGWLRIVPFSLWESLNGSHCFQDKTQTLELSTQEHPGSHLSAFVAVLHSVCMAWKHCPTLWCGSGHNTSLFWPPCLCSIFAPFLRVPPCPYPQPGFTQAIHPQSSAHHLLCLVRPSWFPSL